MQCIDVRTTYRSFEQATRGLARWVTRDTVSLFADRTVAEGEWLAFRILFADGNMLLEGQGLCCDRVRLSPNPAGQASYRLTLVALELEGKNLETHRRLLEERLKSSTYEALLDEDTPTVRVPRPFLHSPPAHSPPAHSPPAHSPPAHSPPERTPPAHSPPERTRRTTDVVPCVRPRAPIGAETSVEECMLVSVAPELVDRASLVLEKIGRMQGEYMDGPTSLDAVIEHALHLGVAILELQMQTYASSG